jgi:hypothetical protein
LKHGCYRRGAQRTEKILEQLDLSAAHFDRAKIGMSSSSVLPAISLSKDLSRFLVLGLVIPKLVRDTAIQ